MTEPTGVKIKQLREAANLSQEELAKAAGIASSQVELIENGKVIPTLSCLIKLCRSMGVRLGTVLDGADAVDEGLIDSLGNLSDALACLYRMIEGGEKKTKPKKKKGASKSAT